MVMTPYGDEEVWGQDKYKTLKDAEGQSWGVASLGGAQRFNAQMTVEGMGFKSDAFQWIAISGTDAARLEALDTGRTQLTNLSHLGAALAEAKGFTKQVHILVAAFVEIYSAGAAAGGGGAGRLAQSPTRTKPLAMSR